MATWVHWSTHHAQDLAEHPLPIRSGGRGRRMAVEEQSMNYEERIERRPNIAGGEAASRERGSRFGLCWQASRRAPRPPRFSKILRRRFGGQPSRGRDERRLVRKRGLEPLRACARQPLKLERSVADDGRSRKTGPHRPSSWPTAAVRGGVSRNPLHKRCTRPARPPAPYGCAGDEADTEPARKSKTRGRSPCRSDSAASRSPSETRVPCARRLRTL